MTAGANVLKVFRIIPDVEPNTGEKYSGKLPICSAKKHTPFRNRLYSRLTTAKNAPRVYGLIRTVRQCDGIAIGIADWIASRCFAHLFQRRKTVSRATRSGHVRVENVVAALF